MTDAIVIGAAEAVVPGAADRVSGKVDRYVALSTDGAAVLGLGLALATATVGLTMSPPTEAIALWVADEKAALA